MFQFKAEDVEQMVWELPQEDLSVASAACERLFSIANIDLWSVLDEFSDESLALCGKRRFFRRQAFEELLVNRYQAKVLNWARGVSPDQAEDIAQDVFVKTYTGGLDTYDHCQPFRPWYRQVSRRHALDLQRRAHPSEPLVEVPAIDPSPLEEAIRSELLSRFKHALADFQPLEQQLLRGVCEGVTPQELATNLVVDIKEVYRRLFRARRRLEKLLDLAEEGLDSEAAS